jgi:Cu/Ag efflux protein CusF
MPKHIQVTEQAGGDITGTSTSLVVSKLNNKAIDNTAIGDMRVLVYRAASDSLVYETSTAPPAFRQNTTAATSGTTTSTTYVNAGIATVEEDGNYLCIYSDTLTNSAAGVTMNYALRIDRNDGNGAVTITGSERRCDGGQVTYAFTIMTQAYVTGLKVGDIVYGSVSTTGGTLTANKRVMTIIKLS